MELFSSMEPDFVTGLFDLSEFLALGLVLRAADGRDNFFGPAKCVIDLLQFLLDFCESVDCGEFVLLEPCLVFLGVVV